jgi:hypothetical protein
MTLGTGYDGFTKAQKYSTFVATNSKQCGENFLHFFLVFKFIYLMHFQQIFYPFSRFSIVEYSVTKILTLRGFDLTVFHTDKKVILSLADSLLETKA